MILLKRERTIVAQDLRDDQLLFHAHLKDEAHVMDVQLVVGQIDGVVISAYATMGDVPHGDLCRQALGNVEKLVGIKIAPGSAKKVWETVGGPHGCVHLAELVVDAFRAYVPSLSTIKIRDLKKQYEKNGLKGWEIQARIKEDFSAMAGELLPSSCLAYPKAGQIKKGKRWAGENTSL